MELRHHTEGVPPSDTEYRTSTNRKFKMRETVCKIAAVLLLGFTLAGCAASGASFGSSPSGEFSQRDRSNPGY